jgi:hypothetical protein
MKRSWIGFLATVIAFFSVSYVHSQDPAAAFKQSLAENQKKLAHYKWVETTTVSLKGEVKSQTQKLCFYGPDGKVQKQQISAPPQQETQRGLKGRIIAKKKEEMTDYMHEAVALVHQYVPPDHQRIEAARNAGNVAIKPGAGTVQLEVKNYLKPNDVLSITPDGNAIQKIHVGTYLESAEDTITLDVNFAALPDGTNHPARTVLVAPKKSIQVVVENAGYQKLAAGIQRSSLSVTEGQ